MATTCYVFYPSSTAYIVGRVVLLSDIKYCIPTQNPIITVDLGVENYKLSAQIDDTCSVTKWAKQVGNPPLSLPDTIPQVTCSHAERYDVIAKPEGSSPSSHCEPKGSSTSPCELQCELQCEQSQCETKKAFYVKINTPVCSKLSIYIKMLFVLSIITSLAKEVMFLVALVCLFVCLSTCLSVCGQHYP